MGKAARTRHTEKYRHMDAETRRYVEWRGQNSPDEPKTTLERAREKPRAQRKDTANPTPKRQKSLERQNCPATCAEKQRSKAAQPNRLGDAKREVEREEQRRGNLREERQSRD